MYARPVPLVAVREFLRSSDTLPSFPELLSELERIAVLLQELPGLANYCCLELCLDGGVCVENDWAAFFTRSQQQSRGGASFELQARSEYPVRFVYLVTANRTPETADTFPQQLTIPQLVDLPLTKSEATIITALSGGRTLTESQLMRYLSVTDTDKLAHDYIWEIVIAFRQRCTAAGHAALGQLIGYTTDVETHSTQFYIAPQFITPDQLRDITA